MYTIFIGLFFCSLHERQFSAVVKHLGDVSCSPTLGVKVILGQLFFLSFRKEVMATTSEKSAGTYPGSLQKSNMIEQKGKKLST